VQQLPENSGDRFLDVAWTDVWRALAETMAAHYAAGRGHLLTEDVLRFAAIRILETSGIPPADIAIEVALPGGGRGKLDLQLARHAAVEFKFPRDPKKDIRAADTMTLGELLADVYRLATLPHPRRLAVWLLHDRLAGYLARAALRYGIGWPASPAETLVLADDVPDRLPRTAREFLPAGALCPVIAAIHVHIPAGPELHLTVLDVVQPAPCRWPEAPSADTRSAVAVGGVAVSGTRGGARREILAAIDAVTTRGGEPVFAPVDVVAEMRRRGTGYADSTIVTMITSHMCRNSATHSWPDLERIDRALYRRRPSSTE